MVRDGLPVVVIGAGPVGLAAAAHLLERGLEPLVIEAGDGPGASVAAWRHVRMFSPWRFNVDGAAGRLLARSGWRPPAADAYPTGDDLLRDYLLPLAGTPEIAARLRLGMRVTGVSRRRTDKVTSRSRETAPFVVRVRLSGGAEADLPARAIVDASGTWGTPSWAGANGLPALGERDPDVVPSLQYGMPDILGADRARYAGRRVAVLGGGHSAIGSLIDLVALARTAPATEALWLLRSGDPERAYGGGERDGLAARGALGATLREHVAAGRVRLIPDAAVTRLRAAAGRLEISLENGREDGREDGRETGRETGRDGGATMVVDRLIVATGFRPELGMLSELRLDLDPALDCARALGPLIDPNLHSCGTVRPHGAFELAHPEPDVFIAGMKSYGRAPTFLLATGHEQVRSIAAFLAGDIAAARRVALELPETGVCSGPPAALGAAAAACCGTPSPNAPESCCAAPAPDAASACCDPAPALPPGAAGCCGARP